MSVRSHVVVPGVNDRLRPDPDLEHGGAQDVASVVGLDLQLLVNFGNLKMEDSNCKYVKRGSEFRRTQSRIYMNTVGIRKLDVSRF